MTFFGEGGCERAKFTFMYLGIRAKDRKAMKRGDKGFLRHEKICSRAIAHIPGANIKEFLLTILREAKRSQIQLSEPGGRVLDLQWSER